jgi:preprotein translocase subunit SecA
VNVIAKKMDNNMPEKSIPLRLKQTPATHARLAEINGLEPEMENRSDTELRRKTEELKARLRADKSAINQRSSCASAV